MIITLRRTGLAFRRLPLLCFAACILAVRVHASAPVDRIKGEYSAVSLLDELSAPRAAAIHPDHGLVYFSEGEDGLIYRIENGKAVPAFSDDLEFDDDIPVWAVSPKKPRAFWSKPRFSEVTGMHFTPDGHLFLAEGSAKSRVIELIPSADGKTFSSFRAIPVPWVNRDYSWTSLVTADDGRLFLSGVAADSGSGLYFGVVLMRDVNKSWWVIDYGPFAGFRSVDLSKNQDILVIGDQATGSITWWDTYRHRAIGTVNRSFPELAAAKILPDGSICVAEVQELQQGKKTGRLLRVDPRNGDTSVLANGLRDVRTVTVDRETGELYVTENGSSILLAMEPNQPPAPGAYLLENTVRVFELSNGLPPKKWPTYLKGFFKDLGVTPRDEVTREGQEGHETEERNSYTLAEVGDAIPLIAGRVRTQDAYRSSDPDPVTALDFLVLFPNATVKAGDEATPGMSFFSARRRSGRVESTYTLDDIKGFKFNVDEGWSLHSEKSTIYLPSTACTVTPTEDGMDITVAFISPSGGKDYYVQMHCGSTYTGSLTVDDPMNRKVRYGVDFEEDTADGAAFNSVVVAGFGRKEDNVPGWLNIGNYPVGYSFTPEEQVNWIPHSSEIESAVKSMLDRNVLEEDDEQDLFSPVGF